MFVPACDRPPVAELTGAQGRDVMETRSAAIHRKMSGSTRQLPITGFAHKAGVVGDLDMLALLAAQDVPAQRCGAAALDRRHHLELFEAHMAGIGLAPCRTMRAEDIRELERRARHARRVSSGRRGVLEGFEEMIERAHDLV